MVSIRWTFDSGSRGTNIVDLIWCVDGREPQLHEIWCLVSVNVTREIHPTAQVEVTTGTMGQFNTNHLAENGRIIPNIGKLSINGSVQILGIPDFVRNSTFSFIGNLQSPSMTTVWGHADTPNKNWVVRLGGPYRMYSVPWGSTVPVRLAYISRSPDNPRAAARRICYDFLRQRRCNRMRIPSTSRNHIVNTMIQQRGYDREGPVTQ